jgi:hypothetical protein
MEPNRISNLLIPGKQKDFRRSLEYHLVAGRGQLLKQHADFGIEVNFCWRSLGALTSDSITIIKTPPDGEVFIMVAGRGLEPLTSWL